MQENWLDFERESYGKNLRLKLYFSLGCGTRFYLGANLNFSIG